VSDDRDRQALTRVARALREASSALFITGAGMSADSGLPTYRGIGGLYQGRATDDGIPIEVALSGAMFERRPELSWRHIAEIERACRGAAPNRGHQVVASFEQEIPRTWVLTQNVDGFHRRAGSTNVIDIHGDVHILRCPSCSEYRKEVADYAELDIPPLCPLCKAVVRPDVVLFGELLPPAQSELLMEQTARGFDVVLSIGTTSIFPYIAQPVIDAKRHGDLTVEINPGDTEVSDLVDIRFRAGAAVTLDALWQAYEALGPRAR